MRDNQTGYMAAVDTRQRIGPAIRQLRQQHGMSLSDLAEQTGISVSYLSRLEKGRSVPSFTLLSALSQTLGVNIEFFVQTENEAQSVDQQLAEALRQASFPEAVAPELFRLSLDARKALLAFMQQQGFDGIASGDQSKPERSGRRRKSAS